MRSFSLIGLLLVVAIVGWMAKGMFAPAVSHDPNDKSTVEYWVTHDSDRTTMLQWCQHNPQQQDSTDCQLATAAQLRIDTGQGKTTTTQPQGNNGVDQASSGANDQLQAQQDSNIIDSGGQ